MLMQFRRGVLPLVLSLGLVHSMARAQNTLEMPAPKLNNEYPLTEDSKPKPGVPKGTVFDIQLTSTKVFPNTTQRISVYVPAQYKGDKPASLWVHLDGLGNRLPTVFDNLIDAGQMPVTIGVGVTPGIVASAEGGDMDSRYQRSMEFDSMDDRFAQFVLEEVLPAVEAHKTPDGRTIKLSTDPNDRGVGGASTGGVGAFNLAWQRPDQFRRVFTSVGTFVGMHGGEQFYVQVRKTESKPIRVFMQDGANDEWSGTEMGDWFMSNVTMERALTTAGYDVRHVWGMGNHNGNQADQLFPEAIRWLWRDYGKPIPTGVSTTPHLKAVLKPGETWQLASTACEPVAHLATDTAGKVYLNLGKGAVEIGQGGSGCKGGEVSAPLAFGPDNHLFPAQNIPVQDAVVTSTGDSYVASNGEIWLVRANKEKVKVAQGLNGLTGLTITPDGLWLMALQENSRWSYSFRILKDGMIDAGERFYDLYVPSSADNSGARAAAMDREGRAYVATRMGVQIMDHSGRVVGILPMPMGARATAICFGGADFSTLYVAAGDKIYSRKMGIAGAPAWGHPIVLPKWGAG